MIAPLTLSWRRRFCLRQDTRPRSSGETNKADRGAAFRAPSRGLTKRDFNAVFQRRAVFKQDRAETLNAPTLSAT